MGVPFSRVIMNAFEQVLSGDLNRLQALASRELQDVLQGMAQDVSGSPINALTTPPGLFGTLSFDMTLGAGQGFFFDVVGVTADESTYKVVRWPQQSVTFAAPDPVNPRIDLVVATPASVSVDSLIRNILVDPVLRTVVPTAVFKTQNPQATIAVVTGVAAPQGSATPAIPAVPAGATPLFMVWVPAAAVNSNSFVPMRALNRLVTNPLSRLDGILRGGGLTWQQVVAPAAVLLRGSGHVFLIDGEAIEFTATHGGFASSEAPQVFSDTLADPFAVAAPAGNDKPYYIYACGGRHLRQVSGSPAPFTDRVPVVLVESLTPPNIVTGKPTANIGTPRGSTVLGALYIGLGFVKQGTTDRKALVQSGDWTFGWEGRLDLVVTAGAFPRSVTLPSRPLFQTGSAAPGEEIVSEAALSIVSAAAAPAEFFLGMPFGGVNGPDIISWANPVAVVPADVGGRTPYKQSAPNLRARTVGGVAGDLLNIEVVGYRHHAPRFDVGV